MGTRYCVPVALSRASSWPLRVRSPAPADLLAGPDDLAGGVHSALGDALSGPEVVHELLGGVLPVCRAHLAHLSHHL